MPGNPGPTHIHLRNRLLAIIWVTIALVATSTLAGAFGAFFHRRSQEHDEEAKRAAAEAAASGVPDSGR